MLKATSALASAKVVSIIISIIRTKILAILLGPSGFGVVNLVISSTDLARVAFACGLDGATARKVAEAATTGDPRKLDHAYRVSCRTALLVGLLAGTALAVASPFLSAEVLGDPEKFWWFGFGAASLVFTPMLGVQLAFLQGLRQSRALAVCQLIASFSGAFLNVLLVAWFGMLGGAIALLPLAVISLTVHHAFLKGYRPAIVGPPMPATLHDVRDLLKLGSGFAINGIWLAASGWLNLVFIGQYFGVGAAARQIGLYGAASMLANLYIGILISSMATEFYPALVQAARDRKAMNQLLSQQTFLAITLGIPVTMGVLILAPWVLELLYSSDFVTAAPLTRLMLAGMAIRFALCPLGYTLLAVAPARVIAVSELAMGTVTIALSYFCLQRFGLPGFGIALVAANLLHFAALLLVTRQMGLGWSAQTSWLLFETFCLVALSLLASFFLADWQAIAISGVMTGAYMVHLAIILHSNTGLTPAMLVQRLSRMVSWKKT